MAARGRALLAALVTLLPAGALSSCAPATGRDAEPTVATAAADGFRSSRTYRQVALPVRLRIPAVRVDTPLQQRGRAPDGTIAVPTRPDVAGWFAEGPRPGQPGPAVLLGHVDWNHGPAVFYALSRLKRGDAIDVARADGSTIRFKVDSIRQVPKDRFPTDLVYGPTLSPTLRLVTCGGSFDRATRNYRDNVIVLAIPA